MGATGSRVTLTELIARLAMLETTGQIPRGHRIIRVVLAREASTKLGLMVNILSDSGLLWVSEVRAGGLVESWNLSHGEEDQVRRGDWIIAVNGISGMAGRMFGQLQRHGQVELLISRQRPAKAPGARRPLDAEGRQLDEGAQEQVRFPITVEVKEQESLGVEVSITSRGVVIDDIVDGAMKEWNTENPEKEVRVGDRIVFANGRIRTCLSKLWKSGTLHLVICRGNVTGKGEVLSQEAANRLPMVRLSSKEDLSEGDACGICLDEWAPGTEALELPCGHRFHKECAIPWLTQHNAVCPLCLWPADHDRGCSKGAHCHTHRCCHAQIAKPINAGCADGNDSDDDLVDDIDEEVRPSETRQLPSSMISGCMQASRARYSFKV